MHAKPSGLGVEFADPWLRTDRPPLPNRLRLIVAYRSLGQHARNEHALFLAEEGPYPQVWLAIAPDLSDILMWAGDKGKLVEPAVTLLQRLSPESFGRVLELSEPYLTEAHFRQVIRLLLYTRHREENPGGALTAGALSADAYDEVAGELYSQALLGRKMAMAIRESDPFHEHHDQAADTREPGRLESVPLASDPSDKHELALEEDGALACYWCGEWFAGGDFRRSLVETCAWKTLLAEKQGEDREPLPLPDELRRLKDSGHRLHGDELLGALRVWYAVAPFSWRQCRRMSDDRCHFLNWVTEGRMHDVLAALDRSAHGGDRRVASLIRQMATWKPLSGAAGMARAYSSATWGFVGRQLNNPAWRS